MKNDRHFENSNDINGRSSKIILYYVGTSMSNLVLLSLRHFS